MTKVQNVNISLSPLLTQTIANKNPEKTTENISQNVETSSWSPLLAESILAQNQQILIIRALIN